MLTDAINVGPFVIKYLYIVFAITLAATYFTMKYKMKNQPDQSKIILDEGISAGILYFLVWKFSYILFHFSNFIDNPISAVYFNGGTIGSIAGVLAAGGYLYIKFKKANVSPLFVVNAAITGLFSAYSFYHLTLLVLFQLDVLYNALQVLLAFALLAMTLKHDEKSVITYLLWFSIGQVFLLMLKDTIPVLLIFSLEQVIYFVLAIALLFIDTKQEGNRRKL